MAGRASSTPSPCRERYRFDLITPSGTGAVTAPVTGFSTVDIVVDSRGNPRVSYAMDFSPDGFNEKQVAIAAGSRPSFS